MQLTPLLCTAGGNGASRRRDGGRRATSNTATAGNLRCFPSLACSSCPPRSVVTIVKIPRLRCTQGTNSMSQVFKPGQHGLREGEELDYDRTAYDCLHKWSLQWPCLRCAIASHRQLPSCDRTNDHRPWLFPSAAGPTPCHGPRYPVRTLSSIEHPRRHISSSGRWPLQPGSSSASIIAPSMLPTPPPCTPHQGTVWPSTRR